MAATDAWDTHLEDTTEALGAMLAGPVRGHVRLLSADGWTAEFRGHGRSVTAAFSHPQGAEVAPDDYRLAVLYGCEFSPAGDEGRPTGFVKTLSVREGFAWDEEMLREFVLEALGLFRFILHAGGAAAVRFEATMRDAPTRPEGARRRTPRRGTP